MKNYDKIETRAYSAFKKVRNKIRLFYPDQILYRSITLLYHPNSNDIKFISTYSPWILLIIIKWTIEFGDFLSPEKKDCTERRFNEIVNLVKNYNGECRLPNEYPNIIMFFRTLAFQQFWLLEKYTKNRLARQQLLFGNLEENHRLKVEFKNQMGITLNNFLILSFTILSHFINKDKIFIEEKYFDTISDKFPKGTIETFLEQLSKDPTELKEYLTTVQTNRNFSTEFYEQSPLKKYPLLKYENKYFCYSPDLLSISIENFIYDKLKETNPQQFSAIFGRIFESYIKYAMGKYSIRYYSEAELLIYFMENEKCVDFLIREDTNNILIDSKGIELPKLGMLTYIQNILMNKTKNSIIKGIEQGFSTSQKISTDENLKEIVNENEKNFLIIISYKDIYVGNGTDFYENIAKEKLDNIKLSYPKAKLEFKDINILSIEDFELLLETKHKTKLSFSDILIRVSKDDEESKTKKFQFRMHLDEILSEHNIEKSDPEYINTTFNNMVDDCIQMLK